MVCFIWNCDQPTNVVILKQSTLDIFWNWFKFEWCFCVSISHAVKWRNNSHFCFEFSIFDVQKQERTFRIKPKLAKLSYLLVLINVLHQSSKVRQEIKSLGFFFSCPTFSNNVIRGNQNDAISNGLIRLLSEKDFCIKLFPSNAVPNC